MDVWFAIRPESKYYGGLRVWVGIDAELSVRRGVQRDAEMSDAAEGEAIPRDRYLTGEQRYTDEFAPQALANVTEDNTTLRRTRFHTPTQCSRSA